jgi:hypothetical protein
MSITLGSFTIAILFTIILNIFDLCDDRKLLNANQLSDHTIIKNEFKDMETLYQANSFQFAFYVTLYNYPFFGIFSLYRYDQPRYLRFWIEILSILLALTFSLVPYYKQNFEYGQVFMDKRDIEQESLSINNLPLRINDILNNFIYNILASIIIAILMTIFLSIVQWEKFIYKYWKYRKNLIKRYITAYMIKPLILPAYWNSVKIRLLAYYRICGVWIIKKRGSLYKKNETEIDLDLTSQTSKSLNKSNTNSH